jgi:hypothetical protein
MSVAAMDDMWDALQWVYDNNKIPAYCRKSWKNMLDYKDQKTTNRAYEDAEFIYNSEFIYDSDDTNVVLIYRAIRAAYIAFHYLLDDTLNLNATVTALVKERTMYAITQCVKLGYPKS